MTARSLLRAVRSKMALVANYYLLALDRSSTWAIITILAIGLMVFSVLAILGVGRILLSAFPGLRAVHGRAASVPLLRRLDDQRQIPQTGR